MRTGFESQPERTASGLLVERHKALIKFDSPVRSYIRPLYQEAKQFLAQTGVEFGRMRMFTGHTTMGLDLIEADEPKLLNDIDWVSKILVPADIRGSEYRSGLIDSNQYPVSDQWTHNCEDNPLLPPDQRDHDRNPDKHVRTQLLSRSDIFIDIEEGVFEIEGTFKRPMAFEFDGGEASELRPMRKRKIVMTIDEYAREPKVYPSIELPPYRP